MENKLDKTYTDLLQDILDNGVKKQTRNGKTLSVFGRTIRYKFKDGKFPLLTTKKMPFKTIVTELLWFLRGDTNIKYLVDNGCHIWDGDAFANYSKNVWKYTNLELLTKEEFIDKIKTDDEFAKKWGELGPVYGKQWRNWCGYEKVPSGWNHGSITHYKEVPKCDQISTLINDLKTNPDSRRLMVNAWNVGELDQMTLPPCHYGFQVYTRELSLDERYKLATIDNNKEKLPGEPNYTEQQQHSMLDELVPKRAISLMWNQRSCDFPLGIPANIMSYAILLMMLAKQVNMVPYELIGNFGDCHIYLNQIDGVKEQVNREPYPLPSVKLSDKVVNDLSEYTYQDIILENYQSHPKIYFPLSN
jgi:thymidylate synthase